MQIGEREHIQAAEHALARRRKLVAKLEAQANCQAQQQRAFARVSLHPLPSLYRKEKKRKDYAFRRQFDEKPSSIPGCPGPSLHICILAEGYSEATDLL